MQTLNASDPKGAHGDTELELHDDGSAVLIQRWGGERHRVRLSDWQVANIAGIFRRHREACATQTQEPAR